MKKETPDIPTHLVKEARDYNTVIGPILRKLSIDELPQLINIIKGEMVFVGPRPALHNQDDLKTLRTEKGLHKLKPGVTGWAQVNGRDELRIPEKVKLDEYYLQNKSFCSAFSSHCIYNSLHRFKWNIWCNTMSQIEDMSISLTVGFQYFANFFFNYIIGCQ